MRTNKQSPMLTGERVSARQRILGAMLMAALAATTAAAAAVIQPTDNASQPVPKDGGATLSQDDMQSGAEALGTYAEAIGSKICPSTIIEREAIGGASFSWPGSTELYLYGCSLGAAVIPADQRYELCPKIPEILLDDPIVSIHVPLHEWERRGAMAEAERLISLGCVDGSLDASETGDASVEDPRRALEQIDRPDD